jgi:hypothetical protein
MIWRLRRGERWVYVDLLLEFQSSVDHFIAVRLLICVGPLYQNLTAAGEILWGSSLPPVLPIVRFLRLGTARERDPDRPATTHNQHWSCGQRRRQ